MRLVCGPAASLALEWDLSAAHNKAANCSVPLDSRERHEDSSSGRHAWRAPVSSSVLQSMR